MVRYDKVRNPQAVSQPLADIFMVRVEPHTKLKAQSNPIDS